MNSYIKDLSTIDWIDRLTILSKNLTSPLVEIVHGVRSKSIPAIPCLGAALFFQFLFLLRIDKAIFRVLGLTWIYPRGTFFLIYYFTMVGAGLLMWGIIKVGEKRRLTRKLTEVFKGCGLQNNLGKLPNFVFDKPVDNCTRKLRLTRAILPMETFEKARGAINGALQIWIDEIRENRIEGTVDFIYSHTPMPEKYDMPDIMSIGRARFLVGTTRSRAIYANLDSCPHLLVAGQTGKGKSTFLRQFITSLYLNDNTTEFTLVDLKGGLEFQTFERLPRVSIPGSIGNVVYEIKKLSNIIEQRMKLLKENHCKDITAFQALPPSQRVDVGGVPKKLGLNRHVIVVDEAAEMFLAGHHASAQDIQEAKKMLSKVARQGRSLGVHLVVATQRPDSKALDPQVKANLSGVVCFQMANDASSITVLGNGRATDLPPTPGRAIWKTGSEMIEVQTPLLITEDADTKLRDLRQDVNSEDKPAHSAIEHANEDGSSRDKMES